MSKRQQTSPSVNRTIVAPLVLFLLLATSIRTPANGASITISGTVRDAEGKTIAGADVYCVADPRVRTVSADDGSFSLTGAIAEPTAPSQLSTQSRPTLTRTPIAAAKTGFMTTQVLSPALSAKDVQMKLYPAISGTTVTLMGTRMGPYHLREEAQWDIKKGEAKLRFVFLLAFDGPPGIKAEVDQIWADYHPGSSLDADAAKQLENQFKARLLYYIDGPLAEGMDKKERYGGGHLMSVTGTIREHDGKQYITASETGDYKGPKYPDRIGGPEKPLLQLPVKPPLRIKLTDKLSDDLIYVPPGTFYMGNALEQNPHWQEAPSQMVTFTKGFYLSDHPITNAEYAAVTGDANCNPKKHPDDAAVNISCEMFYKYVKALEKLNRGKVIRCPTKAEWEYVARSGTSNIEFRSNSDGRCGETCNRTVPVKSKKPNGWGFYGIICNDGSERSCDAAFYTNHFLPAVTDPRYPAKQCGPDFVKDHIHANGGKDDFPVNELLNDNSNVGRDLGGEQRNNFLHIRQRVLVEEMALPGK